MANKNVPQLTVTTTTTGSWVEITIPDGLGGYLSRRIAFSVLQAAMSLASDVNKGYFVNEAALVAAYPVGENGWYAINGDTDTVWIWDGDTDAWIDTTNGGVVISVNGLTGTVVLTAANISFTSAQGLTSVLVGDALDELKLYVDAAVAGISGTNVLPGTIVDGDLTAGVWTYNHGKGTQVVELIIYDDNGIKLGIDGMMSITDDDNIQVDFGGSISGTLAYIFKYWNL